MAETNNPYKKIAQDLNQQSEPPPSYIPLNENSEINFINASAPEALQPPLVSTQIATTSTTNALYTTVPTINMNPPVGPHTSEITCPQCRCRIKTKVRHRSTARTHIACLLLSWTCCCCCLPYCMDSCRNADHFCPMCGAFVGTYQS